MALLIEIVGIAFVVGVVGTGLGGALTLIGGNPSRKTLSVFLGFSGGVMMSLVSFDLMPEAFKLTGTWVGLVGLLVGALLTAAIDLVFPHIHKMCDDRESSRFMRTSYVVMIGIAMHDMPEGLAVGAALKANATLGFAISLLMLLHNIPEGMAVAGPLLCCGKTKKQVLWFSAMAGLPSVLGAGIGAAIGSVSPALLGFSFAFAAGAMLFISFDELIPGAQELAEGHSGTFGGVAGMLVAIILSQVIHP